MRTTILLFSFFIYTSCASANWKPVDVVFSEQPWRICTEEIDGKKMHLKGLCYWQKQVKKKRIGKDKIRRVHKFCSFLDESCLIKFPLSGKKVK